MGRRYVNDSTRVVTKSWPNARTRPTSKIQQIVVRLDDELWDFVQSEVERLNKENVGLSATTSDVVRMALKQAMVRSKKRK